MRSLLTTLLLASALASVAAESTASLARALTLHASFDTGLDADFSRGEKVCYVRTKAGLVPAALNDELTLAPGHGRFGGALYFPKKGNTRPLFKDGGVLGYNATRWSATVSVWLRLDPDQDLAPGYCDPVQIVGNDSKLGFIFLEWSKDETPRFFRFAIRPLFPIWNPASVGWEEIPVARRPIVQIARAPFSRETWTHVVFTLENLNGKAAQPSGRLWINGQLQGTIENWDLTFGWQADAAQLVLGASFVGYLDDLAVFNRALTDPEVRQLMALKNGVRDLRP